MPRVDDNADVYAAKRQNYFFPGVDPTLDGQCVSLAKWFMAEMSDVPNPQAARGDARYVGKTLVSQGLAVEVAYVDRRRGDLVCYEYGVYGHIGVVLSGDRTFEENVNWPGVSSKIVDGARVYASRIGNLSEAWRHDAHIYRLNSYNEGGETTMALTEDQVYKGIKGMARRDVTQAEAGNRAYYDNPGLLIDTFWAHGGEDGYNAEKQYPGALQTGVVALRDNWQGQIEGQAQQIKDLTAENEALKKGGTKLAPGNYIVEGK